MNGTPNSRAGFDRERTGEQAPPRQDDPRHEPPLVSIVTIFFNAAPFLSDAIASVLAQDYARWELLLVDDGSTDESAAIAREAARARPHHIRVIEHPGRANLGMSASRRLGIAHARGAYIAFLDADDVWLPAKLTWQVELLEATPAAVMTYGPGLYWYSWTGQAGEAARDFVQPLDVPGDTLVPGARAVKEWLSQPYATPGTSGTLVRAAALRAHSPNDEFRGLYEDQVLFCKVALRASVLVSPRCAYQYRQHDTSCCSVARASGGRTRVRRAFLSWLRMYIDTQGVDDHDLRSTVRRELRACGWMSHIAETRRRLAAWLSRPGRPSAGSVSRLS
jgi:glycosyltransferase involved in cell wall biosynthesis